MEGKPGVGVKVDKLPQNAPGASSTIFELMPIQMARSNSTMPRVTSGYNPSSGVLLRQLGMRLYDSSEGNLAQNKKMATGASACLSGSSQNRTRSILLHVTRVHMRLRRFFEPIDFAAISKYGLQPKPSQPCLLRGQGA